MFSNGRLLFAVFSPILPLIAAQGLAPRAASVTAGPDPCSLVDAVITDCASLTPSFTDLAPSDQASCLCFDTSYIGNAFDAGVTSCANELAAQGDSTDLSLVTSLFGFCSSNANTAGITAAASSASAQATGDLDACSTVLNYLDFCESVSPGFTDLDPVTQAPCLCYSSAAWVPNLFDNVVANCAGELSAQGDQTGAIAISSFEDFCSSVGDVGNPPTVSASSTSAGIGPSAVPAPGGSTLSIAAPTNPLLITRTGTGGGTTATNTDGTGGTTTTGSSTSSSAGAGSIAQAKYCLGTWATGMFLAALFNFIVWM